MSYGQNVSVAICFQDSFGTANTDSPYFISQLNESFSTTKEQLIAQGARGIFYEGDHYEGINANEGELELEAHPISMGAVLKSVLGNPVTTQSGGIYTHVFNPVTVDFDQFAANPPVTIVKDFDDPGSSHLYYDMVGNTLALTIANGEFVKSSVGYMGGKYSQQADLAASYPPGKLFTWDVGSFTIATSVQGDLNALTVTMEETIENKYTFSGEKTPRYTKRSGYRVITVEGTLVFQDQNEYQEFINQSERELDVTFTGPTEIQSGYFDLLRIQLPGLRYGEFKPVAGGPGQVEVPFTGKGVYNVDSATGMRITLVNTQPAY